MQSIQLANLDLAGLRTRLDVLPAEEPAHELRRSDRLDLFAKLQAAPPIKFKDMEAFMATSKILTGPPFLFDVRTDYVKVTNDTILVPLTLQI